MLSNIPFCRHTALCLSINAQICFYPLATAGSVASEHQCPGLLNPSFQFSWVFTQKWNCWTIPNSLLNFQGHTLLLTILSALFCIHTNSAKGSSFHTHTHTGDWYFSLLLDSDLPTTGHNVDPAIPENRRMSYIQKILLAFMDNCAEWKSGLQSVCILKWPRMPNGAGHSSLLPNVGQRSHFCG